MTDRPPTRTFGMKFTREWPPEAIVAFARATEAAGFDELWLVEDLGYHAGFGPCGAALAATDRLKVGLGIAPAVVRNAGYGAMEVASLARMFPGRFHMGFGHGVGHWIDQVGATPASWMGSLREHTVALKALVKGGPVTFHGDYVHLDEVDLLHPAHEIPPVSLGVRGVKGMALAGEVADGVIFAEASGPRYVERVRRDLGNASRFTVFVHASTDVDRVRAIIDVRLATPRFRTQLVDYLDAMPDDPVSEFAIHGPFDTWADQAEKWFAAGADSVVFCPPPEDDPFEIERWKMRG